MKNFFKQFWLMIKTWFLEKAWPWIKPNLMQIINMLVLVIAAAIFLHNHMVFGRLIVSAWIFVLFFYYFIWKFISKKRHED